MSMRVLVLGASGMLGNAIFRYFSESNDFNTIGTLRSYVTKKYFPENLQNCLLTGVDVGNMDGLTQILFETKPDVVINCVGLVKQMSTVDDPLIAIPINSLLPHRLARISALAGARFIHISTDCVFSGEQGMYKESDRADAKDLYGRSKLLGEVDYENSITLRTSIIGHEIESSRSLVNWFLSQKGSVKGFKKAVFSGLPTAEVARVIRDYVIPHPELRGLYHVSAEPINKFNLLEIVAKAYKKSVIIEPDERFVIDRSLDSTRFRTATGFYPETWPKLVQTMHDFH